MVARKQRVSLSEKESGVVVAVARRRHDDLATTSWGMISSGQRPGVLYCGRDSTAWGLPCTHMQVERSVRRRCAIQKAAAMSAGLSPRHSTSRGIRLLLFFQVVLVLTVVAESSKVGQNGCGKGSLVARRPSPSTLDGSLDAHALWASSETSTRA